MRNNYMQATLLKERQVLILNLIHDIFNLHEKSCHISSIKEKRWP